MNDTTLFRLTIYVMITYLLIHTTAGDLWNSENLRIFFMSIGIVCVSYNIVRFIFNTDVNLNRLWSMSTEKSSTEMTTKKTLSPSPIVAYATGFYCGKQAKIDEDKLKES